MGPEDLPPMLPPESHHVEVTPISSDPFGDPSSIILECIYIYHGPPNLPF